MEPHIPPTINAGYIFYSAPNAIIDIKFYIYDLFRILVKA